MKRYRIECDGCREEIYEGEKIYLSEGRRLCGDCLKMELDELSLSELAELLGIEEQTVRDPEELRL